MSDIKTVVVAGAAGRMGISNLKAVLAADGLALHGAIERTDSPLLGQDVGRLVGSDPTGIELSADIDAVLAGADALIDFTAPAATIALAKKAAALGMVHVIGTTGCTLEDEKALHAAADAGARIVKSGNMSLGVNLLAALVKQAAAALGPDFDVEIVEMHHNKKVDAPSGTALLLGEAAAAGHEVALDDVAVMAREGHTGARKKGEIGFATLRGGNVVGDHSVLLVGPNERIELTHIAQDRALFSSGAIKAVKWAVGKSAGYYTMDDVLNLNA